MKLVLKHVSLIFLLTACASSIPQTPSQTSPAPSPTPIIETPKPFPSPLPEIWIGDGGLISSQPCAFPCFLGVFIGETRLDEVIPLLEGYGIISCNYHTERIIACGSNVVDIIVGANDSTLIVDGITYLPSVSITLNDIVKKYGAPSMIQVELDGTPEATTVYAFVLWELPQMRIDLPENVDFGNHDYLIENTTEIQSVSYLNESTYSVYASSEYFQLWNGYGIYQPKK